MTAVAIIQARMTSTRLPGKVLADVAGRPLLAFMLARVRCARRLDAIWVATTTNAADDPVVALCESLAVPAFRGDEHDVLGRYTGAARAAGADTVVRLTADCPMIDPALIDQAIEMFADGGYDYLSNAIHLTYPDGLDVEVFTAEALAAADREAADPYYREHVTPYFRTGIYHDLAVGDYRVGHMTAPSDFSHLRWTVDTQEDLDQVRELIADLPEDFAWHDVLALLTREPERLASGRRDAPAVRLRAAACADGGQLFDWLNRTDSLTHRLATPGPVARPDHDAWFAARLMLGSPPGLPVAIPRSGSPRAAVRRSAKCALSAGSTASRSRSTSMTRCAAMVLPRRCSITPAPRRQNAGPASIWSPASSQTIGRHDACLRVPAMAGSPPRQGI